MGNKRALAIACTLALGAVLFAATPFATVVYAEGGSFSLVRQGTAVSVSAADPDAIGMELRPGDIIRTGKAAFVEIALGAVNASVQIAENTTFKCDVDATGLKHSGELYYGRVRAKVAKLTGRETFTMSSPSLVAGVRGTDFGLDVLASRSSGAQKVGPDAASGSGTETPQATSPAGTLYRVFCFEGSVLVGSVSGTISDPLAPGNAISLGSNEMVERVSSGKGAEPGPLEREKVSSDVFDFWKVHPFAVVSRLPNGIIATGGEGAVTESGGIQYAEPRKRVNSRLPQAGAIALVGVGTLACGFAAYWANAQDPDARFIDPAYAAGTIMIGSGTILGIVSLLAEKRR